MSEITTTTPNRLDGWNVRLETAVCEHCNWRYLLLPEMTSQPCPHCHRQPAAVLPQGLEVMPYPAPPELAAPFQQSADGLEPVVRAFAGGIPYAPEDLRAENLRARLARVYLPVWLVDADVRADWQSEAGFDYEVISHQEQYDQNRGGWVSREVKEARVRWEKRVGRIRRPYQNILVDGMEDAAALRQGLGEFDLSAAAPYDPACLEGASVRLPDRSPSEAWNEAALAFQKAAAEDCRKACDAGHQRQFRWKAQFSDLNWTLLLLPVYTSYYLDDQGSPQPVLIHGQNGQVSGSRRASMRRAGQTSLRLLLVGIILLLAGLILEAFSGAVLFSTLALVAGLALALGSAVPYLTAWDFNRKHPPK